jgi:triacylglycerol lipase
MPTASEVRGWARLATGVADGAIVTTVQEMHRAISRGTYRWLGPVGRPFERLTDRVTAGVYAGVRLGLRGIGELTGAVASSRVRSRVTPRSVKARAIATGVLDERYLSLAPELDHPLGLRLAGNDVAVAAADLASAFPAAGARVAVFVHGLVDAEDVWYGAPSLDGGSPQAGASSPDGRSAPGGDAPLGGGTLQGGGSLPGGTNLPDVARACGVTPVLLRYPTGREIARNGADLDTLLEALAGGWPVPIEELTLVGHSMGGLVIRAASVQAERRGSRWLSLARDAIYLGSPHHGSWLEKVANVGSFALRRSSPHSAPLGALLDGRSRGIKDLRFGRVLDDASIDPAALDGLLTGRHAAPPWARGMTHHLVVGRMRPAVRHPANVVFGDGLVRTGSAGERVDVGGRGDGRLRVVPVAARHTRLTDHPEVARLVGDVLVRRAPVGAGPRRLPAR